MDAGLFLDWAEELTRKGSRAYEDETAKALRRQRARYQDTWAVYLKQGSQKRSEEKSKLALINEPGLTTALIAMAQIAETTWRSQGRA